MKNARVPATFCPYYHQAVELIGRRWTGAILRVIYDGQTRFSDIAYSVPGLSDRLLSERLKELEQEGVVTRTVYPDTPVRIEYCLTDKGRDLGKVMDSIGDWAHKWLASPPQNHLPNASTDPVVDRLAEPHVRTGY